MNITDFSNVFRLPLVNKQGIFTSLHDRSLLEITNDQSTQLIANASVGFSDRPKKFHSNIDNNWYIELTNSIIFASFSKLFRSLFGHCFGCFLVIVSDACLFSPLFLPNSFKNLRNDNKIARSTMKFAPSNLFFVALHTKNFVWTIPIALSPTTANSIFIVVLSSLILLPNSNFCDHKTSIAIVH